MNAKHPRRHAPGSSDVHDLGLSILRALEKE